MTQATPNEDLFAFSDKELQLIVDALNFQVLQDEELCDPCAEDAAALAFLLTAHLVGKTSKSKRQQDIEDLERLYGTNPTT